MCRRSASSAAALLHEPTRSIALLIGIHSYATCSRGESVGRSVVGKRSAKQRSRL